MGGLNYSDWRKHITFKPWNADRAKNFLQLMLLDDSKKKELVKYCKCAGPAPYVAGQGLCLPTLTDGQPSECGLTGL